MKWTFPGSNLKMNKLDGFNSHFIWYFCIFAESSEKNGEHLLLQYYMDYYFFQ